MNASIAATANAQVTRAGLSLIVILLGSFLCPVLMHSAIVAIPAISAELGLRSEIVSAFPFVSVLGNVLLILPAGKLADIYGRRKIFCIGLLLAAIGCIISGLSSDATGLLVGRFLSGASLAFVWTAALALVSSIPAPENKIKIMGIFAATCYLGIVSGPLLGGMVIEFLHWRWVFFAPAIALLPLSLIGLFALHWERYGDRNMRFRITDTLLYILAFTCFSYSFYAKEKTEALTAIALGLILIVAFFWTQTKRKDPLLQVKLFSQNLSFTLLAISHMLTYVSIFALPFVLTLYLAYAKGLSATAIGSIIMMQALATITTSALNGPLAKRFAVASMMIFGASLLCLGTLSLLALDPTSPLWQLIVILLLIGAGIGLLDPPLFHVALDAAPEQYLGGASSVLTGMRVLGGFIGLGIISLLIDQRMHGVQIDATAVDDLQIILMQFYVLAAACVLIASTMLFFGLRAAKRG